jgi:hypothetical protein
MPRRGSCAEIKCDIFFAFAVEVLVLGLESPDGFSRTHDVRWDVNATSLSNNTRLDRPRFVEGDLDIYFLWCCEPYFPFGVEYPMECSRNTSVVRADRLLHAGAVPTIVLLLWLSSVLVLKLMIRGDADLP